MTKKYHAAALTVAILAAVLAAPFSPAAAQWSNQWDEETERRNGVPIPGCVQEPYPILAMVLPETSSHKFISSFYGSSPALGQLGEYSDDGGLTWKEDEDGLFNRPNLFITNTTMFWIKDQGSWNPATVSSLEEVHPYIIGEFGHATWVHWIEDGVAIYDDEFIDPDRTVPGECDGPHAGKFRYRIFASEQFSSDDAKDRFQSLFTWDTNDPPFVLYSHKRCGLVVGTLANPPTCFDDVDSSSVHAENIQAIYDRRITAGCGEQPLVFCPSRTVTRAQMAAFLHRAVYGPDEVSDPPVLSDVASDAWYRTFALWAVKHDVIRAPGGRFDPGGAVTRADMAEMLVAAFEISVPDQAQGLFDDTTGLTDAAVRAIEGIRAAGVTAGCATGPLRYCPDRTVNRAQMASFLIRALDTGIRSSVR